MSSLMMKNLHETVRILYDVMLHTNQIIINLTLLTILLTFNTHFVAVIF